MVNQRRAVGSSPVFHNKSHPRVGHNGINSDHSPCYH